MAQSSRLILKPEPDGSGFIYGTFELGDELYRVDIMPPDHAWRGDFKPTGDSAPHATDWVVYLDGEERARVRRREDIAPAVLALGFEPKV